MKEHRQYTRYHMRWGIALILDDAGAGAPFEGRTHDLSMGGAAMHTEHNLFSAHPVTALLAPPPLYRGEKQTIIEIRCRPVYCVFSSVGQCFRIGLQFIKFAGNGRHVLEERLQHHIPAFENKI